MMCTFHMAKSHIRAVYIWLAWLWLTTCLTLY